MRKLFKSLILILIDITGVNLLCRLLNRNKAIILYYHGICEDSFDLLEGYDERHVSRTSFRNHLDYLQKHGYVFINMTELLESLKKKVKIKKCVVLTFDDGFKNVIINAYPIMKKFKAKGCFYVISGLVGTNKLVWTDYVETIIRNHPAGEFQFVFKGETILYSINDRLSAEHAMRDIKKKLRSITDQERLEHLEQFRNQQLENVPEEFHMASWEQIKELDFKILEIGGHTKSHPNCENLVSETEVEREFLHSKLDIEKAIKLREQYIKLKKTLNS